MRAEAYLTPLNITAKTARWLASVRRESRPRPQLQLQPPRAALLVVDMVRHFCHPQGRAYVSASAAVVPNIARLIDAWRAFGGLVIHARHGHEGPEDLGLMGRFFTDYLRADEPEAEIIEALKPAPGETVLRKATYDAFVGTDLEQRLKAARKTQLVIAGVLTHLCCETTARAAFVRGVEPYLVADATATTRAALHLGALRALASGFGVAMSTREVLDRCDANG
ncbi:MAG: cysteine hydrolase [Myxococcales bacterium]|nr:MAG: cysteine hydrolase [Myxococcales bacterium]